MKANILVPMAGAGSRFAKEGYVMPKQLIMVDDTQMLDWSLKSIADKDDCNLIFCVRQEQINNFSIDKILKSRYGKNIKIVVVDKLTALVVTSLFSTHLNIPPPLGFIIKSSPKLSCVQSLN